LDESLDWIEIPAGLYRVGLSLDEANEYWSKVVAQQGPFPYGSYSELPPSLSAAIPAMVIEVSAFSIARYAQDSRGVGYEDALSAAVQRGLSLPTECEWEIAERYGDHPISRDGQDEWCMDYFNGVRQNLAGTITQLLLRRSGTSKAHHVGDMSSEAGASKSIIPRCDSTEHPGIFHLRPRPSDSSLVMLL
jgi:hypothetical protein